MKDNMTPHPNKIPYKLNQHDDERIDNYYWLRDDTRSDTNVLNYLKDTNIIKSEILLIEKGS